MLLAKGLGLDLELVQGALDNSIASSTIWRQRGPVVRAARWSPAPGPIGTLRPILDQIAGAAESAAVRSPVFDSAKALFDQAHADGMADLDIAAVYEVLADGAAGEPAEAGSGLGAGEQTT
jgi:L-threonate 2-dehydrogenase